MNFNFCKIIFVFFLFFAANSNAKPQESQNKRIDKTIITSNIIDIKRKSQTIDFLGNVVVKKGQDSMLAEKMTVYYEESAQNSEKTQKVVVDPLSASQKSSNSIKKIEAEKDVKIFGEGIVASSDAGYYDPKKNLFILEKNVIVNNADTVGTGEKFIYDLTTRKGNFVGKEGSAKPGEDRRVVVIIGNETIKKKSSKKK